MNDIGTTLMIYALDLALVIALTWVGAKLGAKAIGFSVLTNLLAVAILGRVTFTIFGFTTNCGNVFYACCMFGLSLIASRHGFAGMQRLIVSSLLCLIMFVLITQLIAKNPVLSPQAHDFLASSQYVATGAFIAFYVSATLNCLILTKLGSTWSGKITANVLSQIVDSVLFFSIAFANTWSINEIASAAATGAAVKCFLNIIDTPLWCWLRKNWMKWQPSVVTA